MWRCFWERLEVKTQRKKILVNTLAHLTFGALGRFNAIDLWPVISQTNLTFVIIRHSKFISFCVMVGPSRPRILFFKIQVCRCQARCRENACMKLCSRIFGMIAGYKTQLCSSRKNKEFRAATSRRRKCSGSGQLVYGPVQGYQTRIKSYLRIQLEIVLGKVGAYLSTTWQRNSPQRRHVLYENLKSSTSPTTLPTPHR